MDTPGTVDVLPDHLRPGLRIVFCGTAAGERSGQVGHYYANPRHRFWEFLHHAGFTPRQLRPDEDHTVTSFGIGLTDLAKTIAKSNDAGLAEHYDVEAFLSKIEGCTPQWVAFHGTEAGSQVSRHLKQGRRVALGLMPWTLGQSQVFVLPSASSSNPEPRDVTKRRQRLQGRLSRLEWFEELERIRRR